MSREGHRRGSSQANAPWSRWTKTRTSSVPVSVRLCGLLLWVFMATVTAARPTRLIIPKFLNRPNNITAAIGSDVVLPCSIENLGPKTIIWRKTTKQTPIAVGDYVFDPDKNYSVTPKDMFLDPNKHHYINGDAIKTMDLMITSVMFKHAGTYQCVASTKEDMVRNVTLNVVDASHYTPSSYPTFSTKDRNNRMRPRKTGITLEGTTYVEKGSKIDLNCTATSMDYSPMSLDWFKDGSRLKQGGRRVITIYQGDAGIFRSRLEINRAAMTDAGTYVCRYSQVHVRDIKVNVLNTDSSNRRRGTGTEGLDTSRPENTKNEDYYSGTVSRENSKHSSKEDDGCAFTSSVALTVFLVILSLVST